MGQLNTDVLLIGGGPAGIQGSRLLKMLRPDMDVTVLRPEPYSIVYCAIPYAIEGLFGVEKINKRDELVTEPGARLIKDRAVSVDLDGRQCRTAGGLTIRYETLLIVTGAEPFVPPVPGADLANIFTVKTGEDTRRILDALKKGPHTAVVIGAGAIGVEQALAYRAAGLEVHLVDMADYPLPALLDAEFAAQAREQLEQAGVTLHMGAALERFEGQAAVSAVQLANGERLALREGVDFVVVSVGVRPALDLFEDSDLERERDGLVVDDRMRTSRPGVYAAGDCVHFWSGIDGRPVAGKLATNAVPMAKVAALNIAGTEAHYPGLFNGAATVVGELRFGGTGFTEQTARQRGFETVAGYGETTSRFPMMPGAGPVRVKLVCDASNGRIIGGQVTGPEAVAERVDIITLAIQRSMTAAELSWLSYSAQPWQTFFPARNAIVAAAEDARRKLEKTR